MPFGGAGPLHGVALAEAVSAKDVIVPVAPGITAAVGLLKTDLQYEHTEALIMPLDPQDEEAPRLIANAMTVLRDRLTADLDEDGIDPSLRSLTFAAECRYFGQGFELRTPMLSGDVTAKTVSSIIDAFHDQHDLDYDYAYRDAPVELIALRGIGTAQSRRLTIPKIEKGSQEDIEMAYLFTRPTTFDDGSTVDTPRYDRVKLGADVAIKGPAILIQQNATTLVPPGYVAITLDHGNMRICAI